jgi:hypothetical protein
LEKRTHDEYKEKLQSYDEEDAVHPRNFLSQIYENDVFVNMKENAERELMEQARL